MCPDLTSCRSAPICTNIELFLYLFNGLLLFVAIYLITMGVYYSRIPGPPINGSQVAVITSILICVITTLKLITIPLRLNQLTLNIIYLVLLITLLCAQIFYGIRVFTVGDTVQIRSYLKNAYNVKTENDINRNILKIHEYYKCCGIDGPDDPDVNIKGKVYISAGIGKSTLYNATILIRECCSNEILILCTKLDAYTDGCLNKIYKIHKESRNIIGTFFVLSSIVLIPVIVIGFKGLELENEI